ncbi:MAG: VapE domain-containing protein [Hyphomicrobiales bacterium]
MTSFADYALHGWKLCAITPGAKSPDYAGWNTRPIPADAADALVGAGLLHALSGTCALDVDDSDLARPWLAERGIDLDALLAADDAVQISSGRINRCKLIYRMARPLRTLKPAGSGLELRCATGEGKSVQDVLPFTVHPDTKKPYVWRLGLLADWRAPPPIPAALVAAWRDLADPILPSAATPAAAPLPSPDVDRLRALLSPHDPDSPYDQWIKAGMAIHNATGGSPTGLAVWDEWSKRGKKYKGVADLRTHWASFTSAPGKRVVTAASLEVEKPAAADEFPVGAPAATEIVAEATERPKRNPRIASALGLQTSGENGKLVCNVYNAEIMTRNLVATSTSLVFDEFLSRKLVQWPTDTAPHAWQDVDTVKLQVELQRRGLQTLSTEAARNAAERIAHENPVNCVADWLTSLVWDGERRLTMFLPRAFRTPTDRYYLRSGRNWILSMVRRAYEPKCQVDTATVLEGPQGSLKSSALRILGTPWYAELVADPDSKDFEQQLRGIWLGEFPELQSLQRGSIERLKQFITNREDRYRPSFGREEVAYPRRCVLVGTTNRTDWARDETGNRRFIPVECTHIDLAWLAANRDQLFAEGVAEYKRGRTHWHWPKSTTLEKQAERAPSDLWSDPVERNWRDAVQREAATGREFVTVSDVLVTVLGIQPAAHTGVHHARMAHVLRGLGFESASQRRINGVRCRPWYAPAVPEKDPLLG